MATNNRARGSKSRARQLESGGPNADGEPQIPSPAFQALDQQIFGLDGRFDQLADKTPWEIYAGIIAGEWQLCANCQPDTAAKKLYRQYNMSRIAQGLPVVDVPIDDTEYAKPTFPLWSAIYLLHPVGAVNVVPNYSSCPEDCVITAQVGKGLANIQINVNLADSLHVFTSGPLWAAITQIVIALGGPRPVGSIADWGFTGCVSKASGAPGVKCNPEIVQQ